MPMTLKPGARLFSAGRTTELFAAEVPTAEVDLTIGGVAPVGSIAERTQLGVVAEGHTGVAATGKRYVDSADTIELLCTKADDGVPALGCELLLLKEAKSLPASD